MDYTQISNGFILRDFGLKFLIYETNMSSCVSLFATASSPALSEALIYAQKTLRHNLKHENDSLNFLFAVTDFFSQRLVLSGHESESSEAITMKT